MQADISQAKIAGGSAAGEIGSRPLSSILSDASTVSRPLPSASATKRADAEQAARFHLSPITGEVPLASLAAVVRLATQAAAILPANAWTKSDTGGPTGQKPSTMSLAGSSENKDAGGLSAAAGLKSDSTAPAYTRGLNLGLSPSQTRASADGPSPGVAENEAKGRLALSPQSIGFADSLERVGASVFGRATEASLAAGVYGLSPEGSSMKPESDTGTIPLGPRMEELNSSFGTAVASSDSSASLAATSNSGDLSDRHGLAGASARPTDRNASASDRSTFLTTAERIAPEPASNSARRSLTLSAASLARGTGMIAASNQALSQAASQAGSQAASLASSQVPGSSESPSFGSPQLSASGLSGGLK